MPILGSFGAGSKGGFGRGGAAIVEGVNFLVIAGGGGGKNQSGSGGGAGGYVSSTAEGTGGGNPASSALNFQAGVPYTVTIGGGGAGRVGDQTTPSIQGSNSILQHLDATLTIYGGGAEGYAPSSATIGSGQGIGPGNFTSNPTGQATTSGQGYPGGGAGACGANPPQCNSGGGGGASGAGQPGTNGNAGDGGPGLTSAIDSTDRAGGGGGSGRSGQGISAGTATDGGGSGVTGGTGANPGAANTGGGGGGTEPVPNPGGAGGSGVILLKYPDNFSITFSAGVTASTASAGGFKTTTITATSTGSETLTFG
jgi:hypothetical protein